VPGGVFTKRRCRLVVRVVENVVAVDQMVVLLVNLTPRRRQLGKEDEKCEEKKFGGTFLSEKVPNFLTPFHLPFHPITVLESGHFISGHLVT